MKTLCKKKKSMKTIWKLYKLDLVKGCLKISSRRKKNKVFHPKYFIYTKKITLATSYTFY